MQPVLENVKICGVAFTLEPGTNEHYYVINYDTTGSTSVIISGKGTENYLYYQFKDFACAHKDNTASDHMYRICGALKELEIIFNTQSLDVEFAFDMEDSLYIFQARPLCINGRVSNRNRQKLELECIADKIGMNNRKKPFYVVIVLYTVS